MKFHHGTKIKAISAGLGDGLAITTKGHLLSWGFNDDGELGIGTQTASLRPVRVGFPAGVKVKIIAAGQQHSLAVSTTGQLYGWGFNQDGELGNGTTMDTDTPVPVSLDGPLMPARPARAAGAPGSSRWRPAASSRSRCCPTASCCPGATTRPGNSATGWPPAVTCRSGSRCRRVTR